MFILEAYQRFFRGTFVVSEYDDIKITDTDDLVAEYIALDEVYNFIKEHVKDFINLSIIDGYIIRLRINDEKIMIKKENFIIIKDNHSVTYVRDDDYIMRLKIDDVVYFKINGETRYITGDGFLVLSFPYRMNLSVNVLKCDLYVINSAYFNSKLAKTIDLDNFVYEKGSYNKVLKDFIIK